MSRKKIILIFLTGTLGGAASGYIFTNSYNYGLCYVNLATNIFNVSCHETFEHIGNALFYGMPALAFIFLILLFVPQAFSAWKKFAIWFIPLAALLFAFYPDPGPGDFLSPYPEQVFRWVSSLYVVISIVVIAWSSLRNRKRA